MRIDSRKPKAAALSAALTELGRLGVDLPHRQQATRTVDATLQHSTLVIGSIVAIHIHDDLSAHLKGIALGLHRGVPLLHGTITIAAIYYSSNVLYHYRTGEWTQDSEGFWRDSDGYYVVAAGDMAQGSTFTGSKGDCKVYDSGCAAGTTDYYTGW